MQEEINNMNQNDKFIIIGAIVIIAAVYCVLARKRLGAAERSTSIRLGFHYSDRYYSEFVYIILGLGGVLLGVIIIIMNI